MSRLLLLFFAVLLPTVFAWSAAAAYCQHETVDAAAAQHVGHHVHQHDGASDESGAGSLSSHPDCATCHAAGVPLIMGSAESATPIAVSTPAVALGSPPFRSALARAPDRPQWLRLSV